MTDRTTWAVTGILHVLKVGCRWIDCPREYGPATTVYNRFNRWSKAGVWQAMAAQLVKHDATDIMSIDSTTSKAHRCSAGGKGGLRSKPSAAVAAAARRKSTRSSTPTGA